MKKLITKKDCVLLFVVLLVGVVGIILMNSADNGKSAEIIVDGVTQEVISLDEAFESRLTALLSVAKMVKFILKSRIVPIKSV